MNTKILSSLAALALIAASVVFPVNAYAVTTTFSVVGILAILYADYGREIKPLLPKASIVSFDGPRHSGADLREAA